MSKKTLINKLFAIAENDFIGHSFRSFPSVKKDKRQVQYFTIEQWKLLLRTVFELVYFKERKVRKVGVILRLRQYLEISFKSFLSDEKSIIGIEKLLTAIYPKRTTLNAYVEISLFLR